MVRLETHRRSPNFPARHYAWRLFAMILGVALVLVAMRELRRPEVADRLEAAFTPAGPTAELPPPAAELPTGTFRSPGDAEHADPANSDLFPGVQPQLLESIRDNSAFHSAETAAWFHLWEILQGATPDQLAAASRGNVDYAQLTSQPHVYRGQVVTVQGMVRRVEAVQPAENDLGLDQLYVLTLQPPGGQIWPVRVYSIQLPVGLAPGDDLRHAVQATGFFFKNWSYPWQGGLGLAPVVLTRDVQLLEPPAADAATGRTMPSLPLVALWAVALALALLAVIYWNLRRVGQHKIDADQDEVVASMRRAAQEGPS